MFVHLGLFHRVRRAPAFVGLGAGAHVAHFHGDEGAALAGLDELDLEDVPEPAVVLDDVAGTNEIGVDLHGFSRFSGWAGRTAAANRSEEHTSELQSLMRISYAVFCLKQKKK